MILASCGMIDCVQGSGEVTSENRPVSPFENVTSAGSMDVVVTQGSTQSIRVEAEENIIPLIKTEIANGTLTISTKKGSCFSTTKGVTVYVTMPTVKRLVVDGSGDFSGATKIVSSGLDLEINGSGDMNLNVEGPVNTSIDGSGDVVLAGKAPKLAISVNGSGDVHADKLVTESASVDVDGSGDCILNVTRELTVSVNGSGDVTYRGNPPSVHTSIHGSGDVQKLP